MNQRLNMADFCYDCTLEMFGKQHAEKNDLSELITREQFEHGFVMPALCEGCGYIFVDHLGKKTDLSSTEIRLDDIIRKTQGHPHEES